MKHQTNTRRTAVASGFLTMWVALLPLLGLIMGCKPTASATPPAGDAKSRTSKSATNATVVAQARTASVTSSTKTPEGGASVPRSTFVIPRKATEGKDPFFPTSTRVYVAGNPVATNAVPVMVTADLTLRGISGTPEQPLAIINTTTFAPGETNEVLTKNGRSRVQCLAINMATGTVTVQIGAERRELHLTSVK